MKIDFRDEILEWVGKKIPLKINGALQDKRVCLMLYSMRLDLPILKETEEQVEKILDSGCSKADIDEMVNRLDIYISIRKEN